MYFEQFESIARQLLFVLVLILEFYGAIVIIISSHQVLFYYLQHIQKPNKGLRLNFARHLALGLEFLLAAEIIRTITVRGWGELKILVIILVIRAFLAGLILWEIKQEHNLEGED